MAFWTMYFLNSWRKSGGTRSPVISISAVFLRKNKRNGCGIMIRRLLFRPALSASSWKSKPRPAGVCYRWTEPRAGECDTSRRKEKDIGVYSRGCFERREYRGPGSAPEKAAGIRSGLAGSILDAQPCRQE